MTTASMATQIPMVLNNKGGWMKEEEERWEVEQEAAEQTEEQIWRVWRPRVCVAEAEHTFETGPVCTEHQDSSAHWPALQSPWETILGRLIGSGRVNNGMMGTANVRVKDVLQLPELPGSHPPLRTVRTAVCVLFTLQSQTGGNGLDLDVDLGSAPRHSLSGPQRAQPPLTSQTE
ncbi:hypothetical protein KUCAC02_004476, partial [Chaenocephalus aceratus]